MLSKLMKHELKATARLLLPLYLILLCTTIVNRIVLRLNVFKGFVGFISVFLIFTFITIIVTILIVTILLMIVRFYKNLLTDEGYLMFTLPAKTHQLITSKLLITIFWTIISIVTILCSVYIVFATPERMNILMDGLKEALVELQSAGGNNLILFIKLIFLCLLSLFANILLIYVSIAVGQLVSRHKIIGSFVSYIVISSAMQFLMLIIILLISLPNPENLSSMSTFSTIIFPVSSFIVFLECVGFYAATNYIFKKKLNLE